MTTATTVRRVRNFPRETQRAYEGASARPLGGYLVAVSTYAGLTAPPLASGDCAGHGCRRASMAATCCCSASRRTASAA